MDWGCTEHEWDEGSDNWMIEAVKVAEMVNPENSRASSPCPACVRRIIEERDALEEQRDDGMDPVKGGQIVGQLNIDLAKANDEATSSYHQIMLLRMELAELKKKHAQLLGPTDRLLAQQRQLLDEAEEKLQRAWRALQRAYRALQQIIDLPEVDLDTAGRIAREGLE